MQQAASDRHSRHLVYAAIFFIFVAAKKKFNFRPMNSFIETLKTTGNLELLRETPSDNASEISSALFDRILSTAGWKAQCSLVDEIFDFSNSELLKALFCKIVAAFGTIPVDRRDKFYYFLKKGHFLLPFEEVLKIENLDVLDYLCSVMTQENRDDWDNAVLLEFISTCRPWMCRHFERLDFKGTAPEISEPMIRVYLKRKDIGDQNRKLMHQLIKNAK